MSISEISILTPGGGSSPKSVNQIKIAEPVAPVRSTVAFPCEAEIEVEGVPQSAKLAPTVSDT